MMALSLGVGGGVHGKQVGVQVDRKYVIYFTVFKSKLKLLWLMSLGASDNADPFSFVYLGSAVRVTRL